MSRPKTKEKEREIQIFHQASKNKPKPFLTLFSPKALGQALVHTTKNIKSLQKGIKNKEKARKIKEKGRGKEEEGRGRQTKPCKLQKNPSLSCANFHF